MKFSLEGAKKAVAMIVISCLWLIAAGIILGIGFLVLTSVPTIYIYIILGGISAGALIMWSMDYVIKHEPFKPLRETFWRHVYRILGKENKHNW
jgi:hypothetical protein